MTIDDETPTDTPVADEWPGFRLDSPERVAWLVGKHRALDAEQAQLDTQYAAIRSRIMRDREGLQRRFGDELLEWVQRHTTPERRSVDLLTGRVSLRYEPPRVKIEDHDRTLAWAATHLTRALVPTASIRVDHEVIAEYVMSARGPLPDGVVVVPAHDALSIKGAPSPKAKTK